MAREKTYSVKLTYAELELLVRATASSSAECYCSLEDCDSDLPAGTDRALYDQAEAIRAKVCDLLNAIDQKAA